MKVRDLLVQFERLRATGHEDLDVVIELGTGAMQGEDLVRTYRLVLDEEKPRVVLGSDTEF